MRLMSSIGAPAAGADRSGGEAPEKSVPAGGKVADVAGPFAGDKAPRQSGVMLRAFLLILSLVVQGMLAIPIGIWAWEGTIDENTRHVALFLGITGGVMAVFGVLSLFYLRRWQITVFTMLQPWVVAVGALYVVFHVKDLLKIVEVCKGDSSSACSDLIDNTAAKVAYGAGAILFTTLNSIFLNLKKDELLIEDMVAKLPTRVRMMMGQDAHDVGGGFRTSMAGGGSFKKLGSFKKTASAVQLLTGLSQKNLASRGVGANMLAQAAVAQNSKSKGNKINTKDIHQRARRLSAGAPAIGGLSPIPVPGSAPPHIPGSRGITPEALPGVALESSLGATLGAQLSKPPEAIQAIREDDLPGGTGDSPLPAGN